MQVLLQKSKEVRKDIQSKLVETDKKLKDGKMTEKKRETLEKKKEELEDRERIEKEVENIVSVWGAVLYEESE